MSISKFKLNPIGEYSREASQDFATQFITDRQYTAFKPNGQFDFDSFKQWLSTSKNPQLKQLSNNLTQRHFEGICLELKFKTPKTIQYKISFPSGSILKPTTSVNLSSALNAIFQQQQQEQQQQQVISFMLTRFPDTEEARQVITNSVATMAPDELNCAAGLARIAAKGDETIYDAKDLQKYIKENGGHELVYGAYQPQVADRKFMQREKMNELIIVATEFITPENIDALQSTLNMLMAANGKDTSMTVFNMDENMDTLATMFNIVGRGRIVHPIIRSLTTSLNAKCDPTSTIYSNGEFNKEEYNLYSNMRADNALFYFNDYNDIYKTCQETMAADPSIRKNLIMLSDKYPFGFKCENIESRNALIG